MNLLLLFLCFLILLLIILFIIMSSKIRKLSAQSRNKVHFYVTCEVNNRGEILRNLWFGKPIYTEDKRFVPDKVKRSHILDFGPFAKYKLRYFDFDDMMEGEIREVILSTED